MIHNAPCTNRESLILLEIASTLLRTRPSHLIRSGICFVQTHKQAGRKPIEHTSCIHSALYALKDKQPSRSEF